MTEELGGSELSTGGSASLSKVTHCGNQFSTRLLRCSPHRVPAARVSHPNLEILWFASLQENHMLPHLKM